MRFQGYFTGQSATMQLFSLLLFIAGGSFISSVLGITLFMLIYGTEANMEQYPDMLRLLQFISAIGTFLIPAWLTAWLFSEQPKKYLQIRPFPHGKSLLLLFASMILIIPVINLLAYWNASMQLPEWASPFENWMRQQEDTVQHFTEILIYGDGFCPLLSNLIVIALTAAITEEFLFRGALQRIIGQWTDNRHLVIWTAAILFSAFHLQFYGFVSRMILGAYFGYLLVWSRNIWLPVCAHFFNNAISTLVMSTTSLQEYKLLTGELEDIELITYLPPALLGCIGFYVVVRIIKRQYYLEMS